RRESPDLPPYKGHEDAALLVGESVEGPEIAVAPGDVFLEGELVAMARHLLVGRGLRAAREDERLAVAAEEALAKRGVVPVHLVARLHRHGPWRAAKRSGAIAAEGKRRRRRQAPCRR